MIKAIFFVFSAILLFTAIAGGQDAKKVYYTKKVNPHPPVLDGIADDPVWEKVEWAGEFVQRTPNEGAQPSQQTQFKIVYDENNLFVLIRAFDTEPDKIVRRVTRRDEFEGDWVEINIDSYYDKRTAFSFTINAAGVKGDEAISNNGDNWDANWDPIWYAEVKTDDKGWVAEIKIPFSQLRFPDKKEHVWGIEVQRRLFRKEERSLWAPIPSNSTGWVHLFGELRGLKGIKMPRRVELLPYTVVKGNKSERIAGNPFATGRDGDFSLGLDGKIGITSDLTMDFTINPDFGQVEADPSEVNLSAYETFFEEKRPFFIEGKSILNYQIMGGDGSFSNDNLFYSRRIGRSPHYNPDLNDDEYIDMPDRVTILGAMKVTGKMRNGVSVGILNAVTAKENARIESYGHRFSETVEPLTNYSMVRLQKDYNKGNTIVGAAGTAMHRNLDDDHLDFLNKEAYSGGFDFSTHWKDRTYYFNLKTVFSHIRGSKEAILEAQESSVRYFQRPDAGHFTLDPNRTSLSGHGGTVNFGKQGNGRWNYVAGVTWRSPGLELNDMGYLRRADMIMEYLWAGYRLNKPRFIFRELGLNFNQWQGWNFDRVGVFTGGNVNFWGTLKNYSDINGGINREEESLSSTALRGGPSMKYPGGWNYHYSISSDSRKDLTVRVGGSNYVSDDEISRFNSLYLYGKWQPTTRLNLVFNPSYNLNKDDLQYVTTVETAGGNRYIFGRIDQKTVAMTFRFNYSLTPDLSIQYYGQPFISSGEYSHYKRITSPQAAELTERYHTFNDKELKYNEQDEIFTIEESGNLNYTFHRPNFNFFQFRSNLVVRWQYTPGSTMYLVWTQGRTGFDSTGNFSFRNNFRDLFNVYPDNVVLIKIAHWFSL